MLHTRLFVRVSLALSFALSLAAGCASPPSSSAERCHGSAPLCSGRFRSACQETEGCSWSTILSACSGYARACSTFGDPLACLRQPGCTWGEPAAPYGGDYGWPQPGYSEPPYTPPYTPPYPEPEPEPWCGITHRCPIVGLVRICASTGSGTSYWPAAYPEERSLDLGTAIERACDPRGRCTEVRTCAELTKTECDTQPRGVCGWWGGFCCEQLNANDPSECDRISRHVRSKTDCGRYESIGYRWIEEHCAAGLSRCPGFDESGCNTTSLCKWVPDPPK